MRLSHHAQVRCQQRGITLDAIDFALSEGYVRKSSRGSSIYRLGNRLLLGLGAAFDRMRGVEVVAVDGLIITVWKNSRRRAGLGRAPA